MGYVFMGIAIILFIISLLILKEGKENIISYGVAIILLICCLGFGCMGHDKINNTPHIYIVVKNSEISSGHYQIQLKRKDNNISTFLPSIEAAAAENFIVGEEIELTNEDIKQYTGR